MRPKDIDGEELIAGGHYWCLLADGTCEMGRAVLSRKTGDLEGLVVLEALAPFDRFLAFDHVQKPRFKPHHLMR